MGLKGYRKVAGLSQAELAAAIGSTQSHVSEYENGARRLETMPAAQFLRLAEILDVNPRMLLTGEIPYHDDEIAAKGRVVRARRRYARTQNEDNARRLLAAELVLARLRGEGGFPRPAHIQSRSRPITAGRLVEAPASTTAARAFSMERSGWHGIQTRSLWMSI